ncbi:30S ribosomal protein S6 [Wolbachia endosymbiont of Howardula sp.]|uniref:30S ribosomal protein S6 n=1 Tax=Wolbachia endosymbiont of Howardula sp. TaxID=2916816 RepID=UPI00217E2130|nr:30S ribosomal protein S6 [Wolbachia endosymbiont of Howardula sp.]UWI83117.1 30S ribosomal protein S6 [Wolbachia endosymbiont of Howardula sp.]
MNLYEFTFISHQALLQQEVEEMIQDLSLVLKNIKTDTILQIILRIVMNSTNTCTKQESERYAQDIQDCLSLYSNFLEHFSKILWNDLEDDLTNLETVKLKINQAITNDANNSALKSLITWIHAIKEPKNCLNITKEQFIKNILNNMKENLLENIIKIFQEILENDNHTSLSSKNPIFTSLLESLLMSGVIKHEYWGLLDFAYPIHKMRSGHYCMMHISATANIMDEFIRKLKLNEHVIRYLSLQIDKLCTGSSWMIVKKQMEE